MGVISSNMLSSARCPVHLNLGRYTYSNVETNMAYSIDCRECGKRTVAGNIVWLLSEHHTDEYGRIKCKSCGSTNAHIFSESKLQEEGKQWRRYTQAVIRIHTGVPTYTPYVFLNSSEPDGPIQGIHFNYFKDTRSEGGKLKHGHGPGGAPVLSKDELFDLLVALSEHNVISAEDIEEVESPRFLRRLG